ncbi:hypothetical protein GOBAR_AA18936 [Gossypium barbadense]|uniref:Uncharacterized protein n=1 Tax=Gossypium barbadense TaxID=3634 RepID=A0A2P5XEF4_GOSBA|nr:hypothetical protein GOBAR_AA18936 [Gossypium barbadense]
MAVQQSTARICGIRLAVFSAPQQSPRATSTARPTRHATYPASHMLFVPVTSSTPRLMISRFVFSLNITLARLTQPRYWCSVSRPFRYRNMYASLSPRWQYHHLIRHSYIKFM